MTLVPFLRGSDEHKSKPTQHSVKELQGMGIHPNIIVLRCDEPLEESIYRKISLFCNVSADCVIENRTLPNLYEAPLMLERSRFSEVVCRELGIDAPPPDLREWADMVERSRSAEKNVRIGLVGKYVALHDAYLSVAEALRHAAFSTARMWKSNGSTRRLTPACLDETLGGLDGSDPGRLRRPRDRGHASGRAVCARKAAAVFRHLLRYADRRHRIRPPCSGLPGREFGRVRRAVSAQGHRLYAGGRAAKSTRAARCGSARIPASSARERRWRAATAEQKSANGTGIATNSTTHTARRCRKRGLSSGGCSPDGRLVETVELADRPFYVGVQFHPEFKSRPNRPHPLFQGFIDAAAAHAAGK